MRRPRSLLSCGRSPDGPAASSPGGPGTTSHGRRVLALLREIVLDTETTGTDHATGDRIVEIGCIELLNHIPSGRTHHVYVNPERAMSAGAFAVHGLSDAFLTPQPVFRAIADELHDFLGDSRLVIHNAGFDIGFLNAEFGRTGHAALAMVRVLDTLALARRKHPGASNSLDALCARYGIDNSKRTRHGALLDAELLAEVYVELIGGKQASLGLVLGASLPQTGGIALAPPPQRVPRATRPIGEADLAAHAAFLAALGGSPIWRDYLEG